MVYKGQKLNILVSKSIPLRTNKTIPTVPSTSFVKYSTAKIIARIILITLSKDPILAFIIIDFICKIYLNIFENNPFFTSG